MVSTRRNCCRHCPKLKPVSSRNSRVKVRVLAPTCSLHWSIVSLFSGFTPTQFVDGLQTPNTLNLASWRVDPYMIDSITVLRGPTSALYGAGDPGFNYYDKKQWSVGHQLEHQADSVWTLRQDATLMRLTLDKASVWGGGFDGDSMTGMTRYAGLFQMDYNRFNLDNQAQAKFRTGPVDHTVLLGFEFNRQTTTDSEVRARGIELNATGKLTPNLSLIAAYAFQNVKNVKAGDETPGKWPVDIPRPRQMASMTPATGALR